VILNLIFGSLALLSLALTLWQWLVARRFPLHLRVPQPSPHTPQPPVTLLKPLKGCDAATEDCLRSWFAQQYAGPMQMLFGVAAAEDPVCGIVRKLVQEFPGRDAQLVVCGPLLGANAKVSKLVELERMAKHDLLVISDADVRVPPDLLTNLVASLRAAPLSEPAQPGRASGVHLDTAANLPLTPALSPSAGERGNLRQPLAKTDAEGRDERLASVLPLPRRGGEGRGEGGGRVGQPAVVGTESGGASVPASPGFSEPAENQGSRGRSPSQRTGLVCCFYRLANPTTLAMQWEAIAINADFWSQVLQSRSLQPIDFALGAVMATRRQQLQEVGGFTALADCLADDYQLGNRIARRGYSIAISPVVAECWSAPMGWAAVWKHQLRWARTIRVCQPAPYFFSVLNNATFWPLLWLIVKPAPGVLACALVCLLVRVLTALNLQHRMTRDLTPSAPGWLVPIKDLLQAAIWLLAFMGNRIEWRGERMRLHRDGTLVRG